MKKNLKDQIKKLVRNKKWSVVCDRVLKFMEEKKLTSTKSLYTVVTHDLEFLNRNHTASYYKDIIDGRNVGVKSFGGTYASLFVVQCSK